METIATADAATRLPELLERTARGETFEITADGRPVGRLVPPTTAPTLKDLILGGPSLDGVVGPRDRSPMREVEL